MRRVRRWVRNLVLRIPLVGEGWLLPRLRAAYERLPLLDWRRKRFAQSEARSLLRHLEKNDSAFTLVYDCKVTGLAYGDLLHVLAVARFLIKRGGRVTFIMVDTEGPHFLGGMCQREIDGFIDDAMEVARAVLDADRSVIVRIKEEELESRLRGEDEGGILFHESVQIRRPYYRESFNVFNQLMATLDEDGHRQVLFGRDEFIEHLPVAFEGRRFVSWHCRYSTRWDESRLTTGDEFVVGYKALSQRFPGREILVVSDEVGCRHYAEMARSLGLGGLSFSKEVSSSFLGDCALILQSEFFFCYRGGGILEIPFMSVMPYEIVAPVMNETMWSSRRLGCWEDQTQRWLNVPRVRVEGELVSLVDRGEVLGPRPRIDA